MRWYDPSAGGTAVMSSPWNSSYSQWLLRMELLPPSSRGAPPSELPRQPNWDRTCIAGEE